METGQLSIPVGNDHIPIYFARPETPGPHPCVIVVHEIFGVHDYIRGICNRLAEEHYYAVAVDLYSRYGDATKMTDHKKIYTEIVSKTTRKQIYHDLDAAVAWLGKEAHADASRIGVTGFCWGGTITWLYAAHNAKLKAGVAWYGRLQGEHTASQSEFPIDVARDVFVPVLGLYGAKDESIPLESIKEMELILDQGKTESRIIVYPNAGHAFHADYRPMYVEAVAKEAWNEMLDWFKKYLKS